jgi:hypothetical protein
MLCEDKSCDSSPTTKFDTKYSMNMVHVHWYAIFGFFLSQKVFRMGICNKNKTQ